MELFNQLTPGRLLDVAKEERTVTEGERKGQTYEKDVFLFEIESPAGLILDKVTLRRRPLHWRKGMRVHLYNLRTEEMKRTTKAGEFLFMTPFFVADFLILPRKEAEGFEWGHKFKESASAEPEPDPADDIDIDESFTE